MRSFLTSRITCFFLVALVAFAVVIPWHLANQRVPTWDGAGYVLVAQKVAQSFDNGLVSGLSAFYLERLWRPIIFPALAAPYFLVTSGNIRMSVALAEWSFATAAGIYIFLFLRSIIGPLRATVGSCLVISLTWFVSYTHLYFYSEPLWLAALAGTIFHLDEGVRSKRAMHFTAAGIWLGLMIGIRPAETVVLASVPVICLLAWGFRYGMVATLDAVVFGLQAAFVSTAVFIELSIALHWVSVSEVWVPSLLLMAVGTIGLRARRLFFESPILGFLIIAELVSVGWHLPTMKMLYDWAYSSSFGEWAQLSDQRFGGLSLATASYKLIEHYSPMVLIALTTGAVVTLAGAYKANSRAAEKALLVLGISLLSAFPLLLVQWLSKTSDERRIMPAVFLVYIGLTALALLPKGFMSRVRLVAVALAMLTQVGTVAATSLGLESSLLTHVQNYIGYIRTPDTRPDPNVAVLDGLLKLGIRSGFVVTYTHCLLGTDTCNAHHMPIFEPVAVSSLARERRLPIWVHYFGDLDMSQPDTLAGQIRSRGAQYVLVDMFDSPMGKEVDRDHPLYKLTNTMISFAKNGFPSGFSKIGCFDSLRRPICAYAVSH